MIGRYSQIYPPSADKKSVIIHPFRVIRVPFFHSKLSQAGFNASALGINRVKYFSGLK